MITTYTKRKFTIPEPPGEVDKSDLPQEKLHSVYQIPTQIGMHEP